MVMDSYEHSQIGHGKEEGEGPGIKHFRKRFSNKYEITYWKYLPFRGRLPYIRPVVGLFDVTMVPSIYIYIYLQAQKLQKSVHIWSMDVPKPQGCFRTIWPNFIEFSSKLGALSLPTAQNRQNFAWRQISLKWCLYVKNCRRQTTLFFYRTQVSLGSGLWVPVSLTPSLRELWLRLYWYDSGWWWYQLNTSWWCQ